MKIRLKYRKDIAQGGFGIGELALVAAGTAYTAYSAKRAADSQKDAANYNAQLANQQSQVVSQQSKYDAQIIADQTRRTHAAARSAMASSGFDPNTGSFTDVSRDIKMQGELTRLSTLYRGSVAGAYYKSQANLDIAQAKYAGEAGDIGVASSILGGLGEGAQIYSNPQFKWFNS